MNKSDHCPHMTYEKPVIIDLSNRSEKGFGGLCSDGSGQSVNCENGPTAGDICETGGTGITIIPGKYED